MYAAVWLRAVANSQGMNLTEEKRMASLNKVQLIGNLGADPEAHYQQSGAAIANIRIATTEKWKDKESGEKREKTEWHSITFFGRLAEVVIEYLRKGSPIYVEGRLQTDKWQDKEGNDRYTTKIIANQMQMLGTRREDGQQPRKAQEEAATPGPASPSDGDDIPF